MKKLIIVFLCVIGLLLTGCGSTKEITHGIKTGKEYLCERPGFGLGEACAFTVTLFDDGTYMYYEGPLSSFIGRGKYEKNGDIITIYTEIPTSDENNIRINKFAIEDNRLRWIEEGSDNFFYLTVSDGIYFNYNGDVTDIVDGASHSYSPTLFIETAEIADTTETTD